MCIRDSAGGQDLLYLHVIEFDGAADQFAFPVGEFAVVFGFTHHGHQLTLGDGVLLRTAVSYTHLIQAAEDAGLEAGTDEYKQAVIDAIAGGTIQGITGTFTFDEHHNPVKSTAILTYVDGKPELKEMF